MEETKSDSEVDRVYQLEIDNAALQRALAVALKYSLPPEPRPSLPVRAAKGGYKLTRAFSAAIGLLVAIAEIVAPDHAVLRAVFRALFEAF